MSIWKLIIWNMSPGSVSFDLVNLNSENVGSA